METKSSTAKLKWISFQTKVNWVIIFILLWVFLLKRGDSDSFFRTKVWSQLRKFLLPHKLKNRVFASPMKVNYKSTVHFLKRYCFKQSIFDIFPKRFEAEWEFKRFDFTNKRHKVEEWCDFSIFCWTMISEFVFQHCVYFVILKILNILKYNVNVWSHNCWSGVS